MTEKESKYMSRIYRDMGRYLETCTDLSQLHSDIIDVVNLLKIKGLTVKQAQILLEATSKYIVESSIV